MNGMNKIQVKHHHHQSGFSLVELAVVIFIIGLIASMSFGAFKAQMVNASIRATKSNQETIKDALVTYLGKNRRLPCPAIDNQGIDGRGVPIVIPPPNCKTYYGLVPYQELGLTKSVAMDGWDNLFSYGVSPQWTATLAPAPAVQTSTITNTATDAFNVGNTGVIVIQDRIQPPSLPPTPQIPPNAAAIIISHGATGLGAYTSKGTQNDSTAAGLDEIANRPPAVFLTTAQLPTITPGPFFKREYSDNSLLIGGAFDDVVEILTPNDLLIPLIKDGSMKSPEAQWINQQASIKTTFIGTMLSTCRVSAQATPTANYAIDPWGNPITYSLPVGPGEVTPNLSLRISTGGNLYAAKNAYILTVVAPNPSAPTILGPLVSEVLGGATAWNNTCP
jgi:prepilin-type N-terminal cleavage/methylation domain-containing protein